MIDTILSGTKNLSCKPGSFELFGFDLMIDEDLRVWLLECNTNPHLGMPNPMMKKRVPDMLNEMLSMTVDKHHPPKTKPSNNYEIGNFWKIYDPAKQKVREFELVRLGLYPVKEFAIEDTEALSPTGKGTFPKNATVGGKIKIKKAKRRDLNLSASIDLGNGNEEAIEKKVGRSNSHDFLNRSLNSFATSRGKGKDKNKGSKSKEAHKLSNIENIKSLIAKILNKKYCNET